MTLEELVGDDAETAREALRLIELSVNESSIAQNLEHLEVKEPVELIKGMCAVLTLFSSLINKGGSPEPLFKAVRTSTEEAAALGHDVSIHTEVLNLLDAIRGNGGSFYVQLFSVADMEDTLLGLVTLFHSLSLNALGIAVEDVTSQLSMVLDSAF